MTRSNNVVLSINRIGCAFSSWLDMCRSRMLLRRLSSVGARTWVQWPVCIAGAEFVSLGDDVTIAAFVHIWGRGTLTVGNRVMIGSHCAISTLTHDHQKDPMNLTEIKAPIVIEDDVWIGTHSVIMPGVRIGRGAVVGASSVVTTNVEPYTVVAGAPARQLKKRVIDECVASQV